MSDSRTASHYGPLPVELDFDAFVDICADPLGPIEPTHAAEIYQGIPIYDGDRLRDAAADPASAVELGTELAGVFGEGAGVLAIRGGWHESTTAAMTAVLNEIIERERQINPDAFDHFAASGANSRAWDTLGKAAKLDPAAYVAYYANPVLTLVSHSWLGPGFQLTAQANVVHPGGQAQSPHRDYHLGFLTDAEARRYPAHVHRLSQALTLQGAVAHTPMPIDSGPTMLLPGSQRFVPGYLAWRDERFRDYFAEHQVQLELTTGDAVFFNPGLHHGAGENRTTDHDRMANLMQISSAFGVAMEAVDWYGIAIATYPVLLDLAAAGALTDDHLAVCAAGYPWPSNLDTDPSTAGLAPPSMQAIMRQALDDGLDPQEFAAAMAALGQRRMPF